VNQSRNLEVEKLRRQMDAAYERAKKLPTWLTRSRPQSDNQDVQESNNSGYEADQKMICDPHYDD